MAALEQMTHKYIPNVPHREKNLFIEEYYCGTDTRIFLDGKKQTEIAYLSYSLAEQLKPIYGYMSRTWDGVAVGTRIVTGTFKVSIKNRQENNVEEDFIKGGTDNPKNVSQGDKNEEINKKAEEEKKKKEWPDSTDSPDSNKDKDKPDQNKVNPDDKIYPEDEEASEQLNIIGYPNDGPGTESYKKALKKFAEDLGLPYLGSINETIKKNLDLATRSSAEYGVILEDAPVFEKSDGTGLVSGVIPKGTHVRIVNALNDGYIKVLDEVSGLIGFIEEEKVRFEKSGKG